MNKQPILTLAKVKLDEFHTFLPYSHRMLKLLFSFSLLFLMTGEAKAQLFINEFMASNTTTIADENGEFEDWIEIYNAGNSAVNIGGYYISDDLTDPTIWQIPTTDPAATTVPAGGYLLLWADKDTDDGVNHVDIKLGGGGEDIVLTLPDGTTTVDGLTFGPQSDDVSYGRSTDGAADFQFFSTATPNEENEVVGVPTYTVNLNIPISAASDDAEEFSGGGVTLSSSDIEMAQDGGIDLTAGFRFTNVGLSPDAVILNAYIQFYSEEVNTSGANLQIKGQANASPFQTNSGNLSSRPTTSTVVNWTPAAWPIVGQNGADQQSPDLTSIVQEIIQTSGWAEGNAMAFIIDGTGTRTTYAYDQNPGRAAQLIIEAEIPLPSNSILPVYINEIVAAGSTHEDASGKREDWIELYNPNNVSVSLGGLYLTDDYGNLDKWQISSGISIPAGGFLTFFADKDVLEGPLHADFSLKGGGEEVALVQLLSTGLTIIDSISYEDMPFLASYGRNVDGGNIWTLFGEITPNQSNDGSDLYLSSPVFSLASGKYSSSQSVSLSHPESGVTIRYTTDGSLPDASSALYTGAINVSSTQSVRAVAFKSGYTASQPEDGTYLINENRNMPIVYLTTDPDNFFDDEIGIYVDGTNGVVAYCATTPVNWAQDWERPANFKMFMPDGEMVFDVNAGVEISGACSRNQAMKSLAVNLRDKEFGDDVIDYELFPQRDHTDYQRLKLRSSGQDFFRLGFRDMVNQTLLFDKVDLDLQAGRPVLLYLNGEFWGIHNFREKYAGEYFEAIYGVDENDLDIIKSPGLAWRDVKKGSDVIYNQLFDFVESNSLTSQTNYDYFESQVDVNEFTNYWVTMTYLANYDWPANNLTVWRERIEGAKWRYGVADTDGSTNNILSLSAAPEFNTFALVNDANSTTWPNHQNSTLFLRKLLDRTDYRDEFLQRTCSFMELIFNEDRANALTDSIIDLFEPNIQDHLDNWADGGAMGGSVTKWNEWIDAYKVFWQDRPANMRQHMDDYYNLTGFYDLTINYDAATNGDVFVNSNEMDIPYDYTGTYFRNIPLRVVAKAKTGYEFAYWLETGETSAEIDFIGTNNFTLTPIFVPENGTALLLSCPSNINQSIPNGSSSVAVSWSSPTANSTCTTGSTTLTQTAGPASGSLFSAGATTITYQATDQCGNVETCSFTITVVSGNSQTISFPAIGDQLTTAAPFGISATASSGLPVSFTIVSGPASINGSTITLNGTVGTVTVRASQAGNTQWQPAANVDRTFQVTAPNTGCTATYTTTANSIIISGLTSAHYIVKVFGPSWNTIFNCIDGDCSNPQTIGGLSTGTHHIDIQLYNASWQPICEVKEDVEIGGSTSSINLNCPTGQTVQIPQGSTSIVVNYAAATGSTTCATNGLVINQSSGPASGTSLAAGTYTVVYQATDDCGNAETCSTTITVLPAGGQPGDYCDAKGNLPWQEWIAGVELNEINNPSGKCEVVCGYADYTALTATINTGATYPITLTPGKSWSGHQSDLYWRVWIDYNKDGDFLDAGEMALEVYGSNQNVNATISISASASLGTTRMRVAAKKGAYATSCETFEQGEVEDYSVSIGGGGPTGILTLSCPSNITVTAASGATSAPVSWTEATASSTCTTGSVTLNQTGGAANGSNFAIGTSTITYEATDGCNNLETCSFTITVIEDTGNPGEYCDAQGSQPWQQWLQNVTLGSINNSTGKCEVVCGYADYTNLISSATAGSSVNISLTPGFSWSQSDMYFRVWIDYNQDGDFTDAGEVAASVIRPAGTPPNTSAVSQSINIPATASLGNTRMRVAMQVGAYANPCGSFVLGEVEDYTLNIVNTVVLSIAQADEVLHLTAERNRQSVALNWSTNTEFKNASFIVERSNDGVDFTTAYELESFGEYTSAFVYYKQKDERPMKGINYYRVKAIFKDGSHRYSATRSIEFSKQLNDPRLFPNPVSDHLYLALREHEGKQVAIRIVNQLGKAMDIREIDQLSIEPLHFNVRDYQSGVYFVVIDIDGEKRITKRFVKSGF